MGTIPEGDVGTEDVISELDSGVDVDEEDVVLVVCLFEVVVWVVLVMPAEMGALVAVFAPGVSEDVSEDVSGAAELESALSVGGFLLRFLTVPPTAPPTITPIITMAAMRIAILPLVDR